MAYRVPKTAGVSSARQHWWVLWIHDVVTLHTDVKAAASQDTTIPHVLIESSNAHFQRLRSSFVRNLDSGPDSFASKTTPGTLAGTYA